MHITDELSRSLVSYIAYYMFINKFSNKHNQTYIIFFFIFHYKPTVDQFRFKIRLHMLPLGNFVRSRFFYLVENLVSLSLQFRKNPVMEVSVLCGKAE